MASTADLVPVGLNFTPCSLCGGGISGAYAAGLPLELIMRLSNHSDIKVVQCYYLGAQTPASDEGRHILGGLRCTGFRLDRLCPVAPSVANMGQPVVQSQAS